GFYVAERAAFPVGTDDARIVMSPAGGIAGSVRIPAGQAYCRIVVSGPCGDNGDTGYVRWGRRRFDVRDGGTFEIHSLRPGSARVSIRLGLNGDEGDQSFDDVQVV